MKNFNLQHSDAIYLIRRIKLRCLVSDEVYEYVKEKVENDVYVVMEISLELLKSIKEGE